ncbi:preprotein translocase subunit SecG [Aureispira anguillae]|uniref:Protein-export membrane protein SecG n=1 Tax=Aureispira anguillae TaxID=2864201 RepID=A0A916DU69_9BACT|nr:preprotein translocase subunit SecG [Aureispira anguillae]BDS12432.1 preprotein translocase subunit SecG [Aureispira anguillae]
MVLLLTILIAFISVLLILVILVQNPKGGGLSSSFGGSQAANQVMGAANSSDMLEKITWGLASSLLALCLVTGVFFKGDSSASVGEEINTTTTTSQPTQPNPAQLPTNGLPAGGQ